MRFTVFINIHHSQPAAPHGRKGDNCRGFLPPWGHLSLVSHLCKFAITHPSSPSRSAHPLIKGGKRFYIITMLASWNLGSAWRQQKQVWTLVLGGGKEGREEEGLEVCSHRMWWSLNKGNKPVVQVLLQANDRRSVFTRVDTDVNRGHWRVAGRQYEKTFASAGHWNANYILVQTVSWNYSTFFVYIRITHRHSLCWDWIVFGLNTVRCSVCLLVWTDGYINMFYNCCYLVLIIIIILVKLG